MKKLLLTLLAGIFLVGGVLYAADVSVQRFTVGDSEVWNVDEEGDVTQAGYLKVISRTAAQLNAITPAAAGQLAFCSDCTRSAVCVSTGTTNGAWVVISSTDAAPSYKTLACQ